MRRSRLNRFLLAGVLLVGIGLGGEGAAGTEAKGERTFSVRGVVQSPYADGTVTIEHEDIPGFMPSMTMPFYADESEARELRSGDIVEFEFVVGERSRATKFRKVGRTSAKPPSETAARGSTNARTGARLREGDVVPAFALIDQEGQPIDESALRGRHTIVTFIFTRCPVPEFCPLIAKKFQTLQDIFAAAHAGDDVRLLSITIDHEHDRPAVLRAHGEALGADFGRWRFATGASEQIAMLTKRFAVRTERNGGVLDHTLATALIGPDGRVVEIWRGNGWKPDDVAAKVRESATLLR